LGDKGGQYMGLGTVSPSCADCLEIWGASKPLGTLRVCPGLYKDCFAFNLESAINKFVVIGI
jgi:hypothetical protein